MKLAPIVAMSRDGLIGREGALPWRLPCRPEALPPAHLGQADHYGPQDTRGARAAAAGANQHRADATGRGSRQGLPDRPRPHAGSRAAQATGSPEALIIGGSQVYEAFLPLEPTIHLTLVEGAFTGDIFFPAAVLDSPEWEVLHEERWPADAENPHDATYLVLRPKGGRTE